jgi:hypothetical protein
MLVLNIYDRNVCCDLVSRVRSLDLWIYGSNPAWCIYIYIFAYVWILLRVTGFLDFAHRPVVFEIENTAFRKLDLFPFSGEGGDALLC